MVENTLHVPLMWPSLSILMSLCTLLDLYLLLRVYVYVLKGAYRKVQNLDSVVCLCLLVMSPLTKKKKSKKSQIPLVGQSSGLELPLVLIHLGPGIFTP